MNFEEKAINLYKNHSKLFNGNGTDVWACSILLENVEYYKNYISDLIKIRIQKIFENEFDRNNVERAMKEEEKLLTKSAEFIRNKLDQFKVIEIESKKKQEEKNTDL